MAKVRSEGTDESVAPWVDAGCQYHEHGDEKQCYKKIFAY